MHLLHRRRKLPLQFLLALLVGLWLILAYCILFTAEKKNLGVLEKENHGKNSYIQSPLVVNTVPPVSKHDGVPLDKGGENNAPDHPIIDGTEDDLNDGKDETEDDQVDDKNRAPLNPKRFSVDSRRAVLEELKRFGYKRENHFDLEQRDAWRRPGGSCPTAPVGVPRGNAQTPYKPIAYLTCISNEEFVDGALVLGVSLRKTSVFLGKRLADMIIIITSQRVSEVSRKRLLTEGTYDYVFEVPSLAYRVDAKGLFRDTFDKMYMFNLTMYEKVVFMDADMIAVRNMDNLFSKPQLKRPDYVGAIASKSYFQTGMLVFIPTMEMFNCIYAAFIRGTPPNGRIYVDAHARDGVLLRDVFGLKFHSISNKYSRNLNPRYELELTRHGEEPIVAVHLRGIVKPWFDKRLPNLFPEFGKKEYGFTHLHWWRLYEEIHTKGIYYKEALRRGGAQEGPVVIDGIPFGGAAAQSEGISPLTHVWMQRNAPNEYVQLLSAEDKRRRNRTLPSLRKIVSKQFGLSCEEVCAQEGGRCSAEALYFSSLNDCDELRSVFGCEKCELGVYWRPHPGNDFPALERVTNERNHEMGTLVCRYNYLLDSRGLPNCTASYPTTRRYCPCVSD